MRKIPVFYKKQIREYAEIDDDDYDVISKNRWYYCNEYAYTAVKKGFDYKDGYNKFSMHRMIMNCPKGSEVDHINHNKLDNRKENLRICTRRDNLRNRVKSPITSNKYKGVSESGSKKNPFVAWIKGDSPHYIGCFKTAEKAALAYNKKALELFGQFAKLNEL